jgi:hypothetical protein
MYSGGVPTRHTQMGRPTYEAPTREYYTHKHTNTNTNKHKQTHNVARQSTVRTHAVAAPSSGPYIVQTKAVTLMSVCARNIIERCGPLKYPFAESLSLSIAGGCVASTRPPR